MHILIIESQSHILITFFFNLQQLWKLHLSYKITSCFKYKTQVDLCFTDRGRFKVFLFINYRLI